MISRALIDLFLSPDTHKKLTVINNNNNNNNNNSNNNNNNNNNNLCQVTCGF